MWLGHHFQGQKVNLKGNYIIALYENTICTQQARNIDITVPSTPYFFWEGVCLPSARDRPPAQMTSDSSSSSAPTSEHSRLNKLTPCTLNDPAHACVETKVMGLKVELYCTEPCPPWSTCPASPIRWRTIDGCSKNARVVLWWVGSRKMSEQTKYLEVRPLKSS